MDQKMFRGPFFLNLPSEIMIIILSRLPIQTILSCKCVCKKLLNLLSTPEFAASHLPLSTTGLVILRSGTNGNLCQIFEYEDGYELQHSDLHLSPTMKFDPNVSIGLSNVDLRIVGSVNGLLCLREYGNKVYDALYICNPITREYIALPRIEGVVEHPDTSEYGFGVSKITGQYKVVRNVHRHSNDPQAGPSSSIQNYECLVYTVGTRSWRNVQPGAPFGHYHLPFSLFLNGNLHGSVLDYGAWHGVSISCFDLESELFKPFPQLPPTPYPPVVGTLGIFDDCLCFFNNRSEDSELSIIWVMKEYGRVEKSWTEILVIEDEDGLSCTYDVSVCPIKAFKNGDILLNWNNNELFYFCSKTKTCEDLDITIQNEQGWIDAIPHSLSFLSLKNFYGENHVINLNKITYKFEVSIGIQKITKQGHVRVFKTTSTVGTRSWRSIEPGPPFGHYHLSFDLFLNGNLHGSLQDYCESANMLISCFDLEAESFRPFSPPPPSLDPVALGTLGILDDCLCFLDNSSQDENIIVIWVMKEYEVEKSWAKQFVISKSEEFVGSYFESVYPIKAFKDDDILLCWNNNNMLCFSNKTKTCQELDLVIQNKPGWIDRGYTSLLERSLLNSLELTTAIIRCAMNKPD